MFQLPNLTDAESIPDSAMAEVSRILATGDLFRYGAEQSPVALLEAEFADALGAKFALAVCPVPRRCSCHSRHWICRVVQRF